MQWLEIYSILSIESLYISLPLFFLVFIYMIYK